MSKQYFNDFVPLTDASNAPSRLSQWWVLQYNPANVADPALAYPGTILATSSRQWATRVFQWARGLAQRVWKRSEHNTSEELFAFASSVEHEMPNLASELRFIAVHRPDAPD